MNAPEMSWVMATTMQGSASRFFMICPLVSGSRLDVYKRQRRDYLRVLFGDSIKEETE